MFKVPTVTINDGILANTVIIPLTAPIAAPKSSAQKTARPHGHPAFRAKATATAAIDVTAPILISISPDMITKVIAKDITTRRVV